MRAVLIVNPASGRGRGARLLGRVRAAFARRGITDVRLTARAGDEARLVRSALDDGCDTLAILGGDGTWAKCAAAVADARSDARLALLAGGTGNDFAKNLVAPAHDIDAMARLITGPHAVVRADMGRVENAGTGAWFLNVAGFGFDVAVLEGTLRGGRLGGGAVYVVEALRQLLAYRGLDVRVDAMADAPRRAMMLVIANGFSMGGAFRIAPAARIDDGLLDLVRVGDVRGLARVPLFARVVRGSHGGHAAVGTARGREFVLSFDAPPALDLDGELHQARGTEVRVTCAAGAISVVVASGSSRPASSS